MDLQTAQDQLCRWINEHRDNLKDTVFPFQGNVWDCTPIAVSNIIGVNTMINSGVSLPDAFTWRTADNQNIPVNAQFMAGLGMSYFVFSNTCYGACWQHKAIVSALTDTDEVLNYDYTSTLWPSATS